MAVSAHDVARLVALDPALLRPFAEALSRQVLSGLAREPYIAALSVGRVHRVVYAPSEESRAVEPLACPVKMPGIVVLLVLLVLESAPLRIETCLPRLLACRVLPDVPASAVDVHRRSDRSLRRAKEVLERRLRPPGHCRLGDLALLAALGLSAYFPVSDYIVSILFALAKTAAHDLSLLRPFDDLEAAACD